MSASSAGSAPGFSPSYSSAVGSVAAEVAARAVTAMREGRAEPLREAVAVLVVDDDPLIIDMLAVGLPYFGFQTLTALSAAEACDLMARRNDIGVAVSDINMPTETEEEKADRITADSSR